MISGKNIIDMRLSNINLGISIASIALRYIFIKCDNNLKWRLIMIMHYKKKSSRLLMKVL